MKAIEMLKYLLGDNENIIAKINELAKLFKVDEHLNKNYRMLSLGTKQKISLIYIFTLECDCILLDEPTISLDSYSCDVLKQIINQKKQEGKLIIISSHDSYFYTGFESINLNLNEGKLNFDEKNDYIYIIIECKNNKIVELLEKNGLEYSAIEDKYSIYCDNGFIERLIKLRGEYEISSISFK